MPPKRARGNEREDPMAGAPPPPPPPPGVGGRGSISTNPSSAPAAAMPRGGFVVPPDDYRTSEPGVTGYVYLDVPQAEALFDQFVSSVPEAQRYVAGKSVKRIVQNGRDAGVLVAV